MLGVLLNALFGSTAILYGAHWNLTQQESSQLAKALEDCLKTLPEKHYEQIIRYIQNFAPWIGLAITAGAIVIPRIEVTSAIRRQAQELPVDEVTRARQQRQSNVSSSSLNSDAVNNTSFSAAD